MCRVLLMNKAGEKEIDRIYGLDKYLKYLEKQLGGHGNGFALLKNSKIIAFNKGVNLDIRDIANFIKSKDYDWCLFHTRLASIGEKTDKNCHPFIKGNMVLAMNGTERSVDFLSKTMDITDTEAILETINKYNLGLAALNNFSSIFMGFYKGTPFVVADNTRNIKILNRKSNKALAFASSFPVRFKNNIYESTECFIWNNDILPDCLKKYKKSYHYPITYLDNFLYSEDCYGQCYLDALENGGVKNDIF